MRKVFLPNEKLTNYPGPSIVQEAAYNGKEKDRLASDAVGQSAMGNSQQHGCITDMLMISWLLKTRERGKTYLVESQGSPSSH